jgi:hypothetical protein
MEGMSRANALAVLAATNPVWRAPTWQILARKGGATLIQLLFDCVLGSDGGLRVSLR